ncbi:MAG: hypothetical protein M3Y07_09420, partial [Acidobacteriota bacterium]|nr:hypothetical protein [Acidobacteriota bacterium]
QNVNASHGSLTQQLVDAMTSLAQEDRRPSRPTLESFADEFIGALTGMSVTNAQVITLQRSITEVLLSSTTNLKSASRLREILTALHIGDSKVRVITKRFIAIGEEVRGPDDSPLRSAK